MGRVPDAGNALGAGTLPPGGVIGDRIVVVGTSGSGKTTVARALAELMDCPHIELDAIHWDPGWTMPPPEVFRARVRAALAGERWVASGNYKSARDIIWGRAEMVVWLDLPLPVLVRRLIRRTARRMWTREELWSGNRERVRDLFDRDNVVVYALRTYWRRRRECEQLIPSEQYAHLRMVRLRTPRDVESWLAEAAPSIQSRGR